MSNLPNPSVECVNLQKCLANYLLSLKEGERILSTRELADAYGASLGSISSALNDLEEMGAVVIHRRGRLGSFLGKKSLGILWKITGNGPMVIALTLPSFPKCEGLATAIYSLLDDAGIETYLIFIRGSYNRLKALRNGRCHATIMSALAAEELCDENEEIILRLPPQSFVTDHRVFYRRSQGQGSQPLRVGIDRDSFDIKYLTELEFAGNEVEYHQVTFTQSDLHLANSGVDAAISNLDHLERIKSTEFTSRPLSPKVQAMIGDRDTCAVLVIRAGTDAAKIVLQGVLDQNTILTIQQKVVDGLMVPRY